MLFPRPSVSSVLSSVLSPPLSSHLSSHFSHLSLTSACPRGAFTNTKARSATRRPFDTHPRQTRERTVDMHEFSRKVGLTTDTGATKDATTDAAADEYHHLGPSSLQAPVLLSGPGRVCTFHAGNGPPRLGCISDNAIRTPTGNHDCNSPSSGCKVVASPLQYAKTIHTFTCEDLPSRNSGLQRFSARSNSLLLDPCGGPPWSERNSSTSTTLDTNRFSNPTVQQQTFGHRERSDPNTSPLALPIWRPPAFSFSSSESDPEDPSVCGQRKPDGQSSLEIHFNQRNSSTTLTVSTTCAEECEISHTPKKGKIDTETKADYPPQLSTNRHYGTSQKVDLRPDCTSLRSHGSNSLHRNQTICGSLSQIERVPKADCHVEVPHPEIPVTKFPTVGLDMLFPVKHDHIGYDWYAPLNFTTFTQYNAPFIILPPTAPSPLASNTLRQRTPFSPIQQLELKRTPTRRINVDLAVQSPYFASFVPAYFEMLDPAGFQRSILNHHAFSTAPVYSRHLLRHLPTMLADDIAEETQIADLMDISGWFGVASTVDEFRLVQNLKRMKEAFGRPLSMDIQKIHDFAISLLQWRHGYLFQEDGKSYFYTFPIPPHVRRYFGALLTDERGIYVAVRLKVLSQGFVKSPCTAQRFSNGLCAETLGTCHTGWLAPWLDNFLAAAPTLPDACTLRQTLKDTCEKYSVTIKPNLTVPTQSMDALSLHFSTVDQSMSMSQTFLDNFESFVHSTNLQSLTRRSFLQLWGRIMWTFYCLRISAAFYGRSMDIMAEVCGGIEENNHRSWWDAHLPLPADTISELVEACDRVKTNTKLFLHQMVLQPDQAIWSWSDASSYLGAWVVETFQNSEEEWHTMGFNDNMQQIPIFFKEIYMSAMVVDHLCNVYHDQQILLLGDNQAALHAIAKAHSMNPVTNAILRWIYSRAEQSNNTIFPSWVSTKLMRADSLTRLKTRPGPQHPITLNTSIPRRGIQAANEIQPFA